jgi:Mg2+/Co2+ transporter CorB
VLKPFGVHTNVELMEHLNRESCARCSKRAPSRFPTITSGCWSTSSTWNKPWWTTMIPRQDIGHRPMTTGTKSCGRSAGVTRLPVYRESIDQVEGLLHIRSVIAKLAHGELKYEDLLRSIRRPYFIPEGTSLTRQLLEFQRCERRMGLVVDEYGDIQGMVTLDDILEEIVGEYTSESRARSREMRVLEDGTYLVDGSASLRTLNRNLGWGLPEDEASTLNGLLLEELGEIPSGKASLKIGTHIMTILEIKENVISKVLVKPNWLPE